MTRHLTKQQFISKLYHESEGGLASIEVQEKLEKAKAKIQEFESGRHEHYEQATQQADKKRKRSYLVVIVIILEPLHLPDFEYQIDIMDMAP